MNSASRARSRLFLALFASLALVACGANNDSTDTAGAAGVLRIASSPGGADLLINGEHHGSTPVEPGETLSIRLPAGEYTLEALRKLDDHTEYHGVETIRHVDDRVVPVITLRLERRLTETGKLREEAEVGRLKNLEEAALARFTINDDGTVTDADSGLVWMRCSVGQTWTGETCSGDARQLNWDRALKVAEEFEFAGRSDWRLPTQPELFSLSYCSTGRRSDFNIDGLGGGCVGDFQRPTILLSVFPNTPIGNFWSSTPHARFSFSAWGVAFNTGHTGVGGRSDFTYARLVRDRD